MEQTHVKQDAVLDKVKSYTPQQTLIIFVFVTLLMWYCKYLWTHRKMYLLSMKVHGPLNLPIIGASYYFFRTQASQMVDLIIWANDTWPNLCKFWLGPILIYIVPKPEYLEKIFNSQAAIEKADFYKFLSEMLGEGLLTAKAKTWKAHRKIISPSFNKKILDSFVEIFAEKDKIFVEKIREAIKHKEVDWNALSTQLTLDIVCETAMGVNMNIQNDPKNDLGKYVNKFLHIVNIRIFKIWYYVPIVWHLSPLRKEMEDTIKKFKAITSAIVKQKMLAYEEKQNMINNNPLAEIEEDFGKKRLAFLDMILEQSNLSADELESEVNTFLAAATDTTATATCSLFTILGMFPDVQQKVYDEIMDVLGPDRDPQAEDLTQMKYTEMVIKETLRLFPVGAIFARKLSGDVDLGHVTIPSGATIAILIVQIHRNPEYFDDPLKFDPFRFLPEEVAKRHPCSYIPFSFGPRNCIGWRYALFSLKTMIATVIRQFKIHSDYKSIEEIEIEIQTLLRFKDGYKLTFKPR